MKTKFKNGYLRLINRFIESKKACLNDDDEENGLPYDVRLNPIGITPSSLDKNQKKQDFIKNELKKQLKDQKHLIKILNQDSGRQAENYFDPTFPDSYTDILTNMENQQSPILRKFKKLLEWPKSDQEIFENMELIKSNLKNFQDQKLQDQLLLVFIVQKSNYSADQLHKFFEENNVFPEDAAILPNYESMFSNKQDRLENFLLTYSQAVLNYFDLDKILKCFAELDMMIYF